MSLSKGILLFVLSDDPIYYISCEFLNESNERIKAHGLDVVYPIAHLAYGYVPLQAEKVQILVNEMEEPMTIMADKSVISIHLHSETEPDLIRDYHVINWLKVKQITIPSDIQACLKFFLRKHELNRFTDSLEVGHLTVFSPRTTLLWRKFIVSLKRNGCLLHPLSYFDYAIDLSAFLVKVYYGKEITNPLFVKEFVNTVLDHFRTDGLFGPHSLISYFAKQRLKIPVHCLPFDIPVHRRATMSFLDMNCAFIENSVAVHGPLIVLWGYQSSCHARLMRLARTVCKGVEFSEAYDIIVMRVEESGGTMEETLDQFLYFARIYVDSCKSQDEWIEAMRRNPLPLGASVKLIGQNRFRSKNVSGIRDGEDYKVFPLPEQTARHIVLDDLLAYELYANSCDFTRPRVKLCITGMVNLLKRQSKPYVTHLRTVLSEKGYE